jgi:hypothetical protein
MSRKKKKKALTLAHELRAFRHRHFTVDEHGKKRPMTYEQLGAVAPVAMMTLYRIETGKTTPMPSTLTVVRQFMKAYDTAHPKRARRAS